MKTLIRAATSPVNSVPADTRFGGRKTITQFLQATGVPAPTATSVFEGTQQIEFKRFNEAPDGTRTVFTIYGGVPAGFDDIDVWSTDIQSGDYTRISAITRGSDLCSVTFTTAPAAGTLLQAAVSNSKSWVSILPSSFTSEDSNATTYDEYFLAVRCRLTAIANGDFTVAVHNNKAQ